MARAARRATGSAADELARAYAPQLATPVSEPPSGAAWVHELELDGHRAGAAIAGGAVRLISRAGELAGVVPELVHALAALPVESALVDGEIVARTYVAFDLLHVDGEDLAAQPLVERKRRLAALLAGAPPALRLSEHLEVDGAEMLATACRLGARGVVSKRRDAPYQAGRAATWQRCRCELRREPAGAPAATTVRDPDSVIAGVEVPAGPAFPRIGVTRRGLAAFYQRIADAALPHLAGRPLTLVRCRRPVTDPQALRTQCAFVHHTRAAQGELPGVRRVAIPEQHKLGDYAVIDSLASLVTLVTSGVVELHQWNARADDVEHPDRIVLDLDPGPGTGWDDVLHAARAVRAHLDALGLASWPRTTGGKGLHVVVPFARGPSWDQAYAASRAIAEHIAAADPALTTDFARAARAGKVLLDYKRNLRTSVAVASFSVRARPDAPVAVPVAWREVGPRLRGDRWTVLDLERRLDRLREDPWAGVARCDQRLDVAAIVEAATRPGPPPRGRGRSPAATRAPAPRSAARPSARAPTRSRRAGR